MKRILYILHKFFKKIRLSGVANSKIHKTSKIESGTSFVNSAMGKYSFCGYDCDIQAANIGAYCSIASGVIIGGGEHPYEWGATSPVFYNNRDSIKKKFAKHERNATLKTSIGNDVWIGRNALIKQGVAIGHGAVVGMGAVVTKNIEPYSIVVGNPAKVIKKRFPDELIDQIIESEWWLLGDDELHKCAGFIDKPEIFIDKILDLREKRKC